MGRTHPAPVVLEAASRERAVEYVTEEGAELLSISRRIGPSAVYAIVEVPTRIAFAELDLLRSQAAVFGLGLAVLLTIVLGVTVRQVSRPLEILAADASQLGSGGLSDETLAASEVAPSEIKQLVRELDRMSRALRSSHDELEQRVASRTADLTEALETQRKLQAQVIHQEKMAAFGTFAAGIAHEIGNPLAAISAEIQVTMREKLEPHIDESLRLVHGRVEHITAILRELVDVARRRRDVPSDASVNQVIRDTMRLIRHDPRCQDIEFVLELDPEAAPVRVVEDRLGQVFLNIMLNAFDAMEDGGELRIRTEAIQDGVSVQFTDTGPGMSAEILERATEPFFTTKPPGRGTGLGLYVSAQIVADLGGEMRLDSREGEGSVVRIELPALTAEAADA